MTQSEHKETPEEYEAEIQAVLDDLDHKGGVRRNGEWLKVYVNEADHEDNWPLTWDGFKRDFAIWVVESKRI